MSGLSLKNNIIYGNFFIMIKLVDIPKMKYFV